MSSNGNRLTVSNGGEVLPGVRLIYKIDSSITSSYEYIDIPITDDDIKIVSYDKTSNSPDQLISLKLTDNDSSYLRIQYGVTSGNIVSNLSFRYGSGSIYFYLNSNIYCYWNF